MIICCLDLEGVLVPEIWIEVAKQTKLPALRLTTRDVPDYDVLMKRRLKILRENRISLKDIQSVIQKIRPLPGAKLFLDKLRSERQVLILSDTFEEFAKPLMRQLGWPGIFCNDLQTDKKGFITHYRLRQKNGKEKAVKALRGIGYKVHAAGDSYNDITMLKAAHRGVLFNPPANIAKEYPSLKITKNYKDLLSALS